MTVLGIATSQLSNLLPAAELRQRRKLAATLFASLSPIRAPEQELAGIILKPHLKPRA